jgi:response regulator RpfG family c-di-GMP phosphodiesterase
VLSPTPTVILLDLRLPKVDGLEVLRTIKESSELDGIPVVILTTSDAERDVATAYEHHANSYLVKPVEFGNFTEMMSTLGFYWLAWNRNPFDEKGKLRAAESESAGTARVGSEGRLAKSPWEETGPTGS